MEHMAYIIREVITVFTNVSFDPRSSKVAIEESFLSTNATRGMRSVTVGLVVPIGNPRYVLCPWLMLMYCVKVEKFESIKSMKQLLGL